MLEQELEDLLDHAEEAYQIPCRDEFGNPLLDAKNRGTGDTLLHVAVGQQLPDLIRYLVDRGLDINARGDLHETPLILANWLGHDKIVKLLLELGADPNLKDRSGKLLNINAGG